MAKKEPINLKEYDGEDKVLPFHVLKQKHKKGKQKARFQTKFPSLDKYLDGGLVLGELYVISGKTKHGKTLWLQSLTKNLELQEANPLWFQFEVPPGQFFSQFSSLPTGFSPSFLRPYSMPWIEERITESFEKYNTRVVFIDHLHYLFDMAKTNNASLEIGTLVRKLKTIAVEKEMVVFLACHTTKMGKDTKAKDVDYNCMRDSSIISQESDSVFIISRVEDTEAQIKVEFHRRTGVRNKIVPMMKKDGWLVEGIRDA